MAPKANVGDMLQYEPAVGITAAGNFQDFGTSRWQLAKEAYINFRLPVRTNRRRVLTVLNPPPLIAACSTYASTIANGPILTPTVSITKVSPS
jgi:hypothetical protein